MAKKPTYIVKAPWQTQEGRTIWRDVGYAYRSGSGEDESISVTIGDYRCILVKRARDIEDKYHRLQRGARHTR